MFDLSEDLLLNVYRENIIMPKEYFEIHLKLDTETIEYLEKFKKLIEADTIEETIDRIIKAWRVLNPLTT